MNDAERTHHPRHIRSFVLRAGRATDAQERALGELWPRFGLEPGAAVLELDQVFGRHAPRMVEIGFGAGEALVTFAQAHPEMDCLGIEVHRPGVGHLLLQLQTHHVANVRVISADAVEVLKHSLTPASIDCMHIFFPDPWPKKRHHKRRLVQKEFVELVARVLKSGGVLRLATDWEHYAHHMREVIDAQAEFENLAGNGFTARTHERPLTRFERRGQRLGHEVWDLAYRRR